MTGTSKLMNYEAEAQKETQKKKKNQEPAPVKEQVQAQAVTKAVAKKKFAPEGVEEKKIKKQFFPGTVEWIEKEKGDCDKIIKIREFLEKNNLLKKSFDGSEMIGWNSNWTEKDIVIANLLRKSKGNKYYLLETDINGQGGYHAQVTHEGNANKAAKAYVAWQKKNSPVIIPDVNKEEVVRGKTDSTAAKIDKKISDAELKNFNDFIQDPNKYVGANKGDLFNEVKSIDDAKTAYITFITAEIYNKIEKKDLSTVNEKRKKIKEIYDSLKNNETANAAAEAFKSIYLAKSLQEMADSKTEQQEPDSTNKKQGVNMLETAEEREARKNLGKSL